MGVLAQLFWRKVLSKLNVVRQLRGILNPHVVMTFVTIFRAFSIA